MGGVRLRSALAVGARRGAHVPGVAVGCERLVRPTRIWSRRAPTATRIEAATLCLVNVQRARHGERALRPNADLSRAAAAHSAGHGRPQLLRPHEPGRRDAARPDQGEHLPAAQGGLRPGREHRSRHHAAGDAGGDRQQLDEVAGPPGEHPQRRTSATAGSASSRGRRSATRTASRGATYTQQFGAVTTALSARSRPDRHPRDEAAADGEGEMARAVEPAPAHLRLDGRRVALRRDADDHESHVDADELLVAPSADGLGAGELAAPVVDDAVLR